MTACYESDSDYDWYDGEDDPMPCDDCGHALDEHDAPSFGGGCHVCGIDCNGYASEWETS